MRTNVKKLDLDKFTEFVPEEIAQQIKEAAEISMGTEISKDDEDHIRTLSKSVYEVSQYR